MLLLNINRKLYVGSPMELSPLILSDLEGQSQGQPYIEGLHLVKELN